MFGRTERTFDFILYRIELGDLSLPTLLSQYEWLFLVVGAIIPERHWTLLIGCVFIALEDSL